MEDPIKDVNWKIKSMIRWIWLYRQLAEHLRDGSLGDGLVSVASEGLVGQSSRKREWQGLCRRGGMLITSFPFQSLEERRCG